MGGAETKHNSVSNLHQNTSFVLGKNGRLATATTKHGWLCQQIQLLFSLRVPPAATKSCTNYSHVLTPLFFLCKHTCHTLL